MKNTTISLSFEDEKLQAIRFYAAKKGTDLETELEDYIQKLYEKLVPKDTREYIERQECATQPAKSTAKSKPKLSGKPDLTLPTSASTGTTGLEEHI